MKTLNEKLESKELHLNVAKKKNQEYEDILKDKSRIENERDDTSSQYKKLKKKYDRMQNDLMGQQEMIVQLKAKLSDTNDLKVIYLSSLDG